MLTRLDKAELLERIDATKAPEAKPLLVMFGIKQCSPCRAFEPVVEKAEGVELGYFDFEQGMPRFKRGMRPRISMAPTLIIFKRGRVSRMFMGATTKEDFADWLKIATRTRRRGPKPGSKHA